MSEDVAFPDDPRIVSPNLSMLIDAASIHGVHFVEGADRLLMPWELHRHILGFATAPRAYLISLAQLRCRLPMSEANRLAEFLATWNGERINPTGMFSLTDEGELSVQFRSHLPVGAGISLQQVCDFFAKSSETSHMAIDELKAEFGSQVYEINDIAIAYEDDHAMRTPLARRYSPDGDPSEQEVAIQPMFMAELLETTDGVEFDESDRASEVTIDRIAQAFAQMGIEKSETDKDFLVTAINDVFLAAFIDNGPSLLIRGHWDCAFDAQRDKLRCFLASNDWNCASATTRALWQTEDDGLQLRVEYAINVESGLTDAQLDENLVIAMHDILAAIDTLSIALSGSSAVQWPD